MLKAAHDNGAVMEKLLAFLIFTLLASHFLLVPVHAQQAGESFT
jgi:hypothetical protein